MLPLFPYVKCAATVLTWRMEEKYGKGDGVAVTEVDAAEKVVAAKTAVIVVVL